MSDWPHSPVHRFSQAGTYMVTAGTYLKEPLFHGEERLRYLCRTLLDLGQESGWALQAWAVFPNHYHFIALTSPASRSLRELIQRLHSITAIELNRLDDLRGRKVWFQYWDTRLTHQRSYLARLSYVHKNAVYHGLVRVPSLYPWCTAGWFEGSAPTSFYKTVMSMKVDRVKVADDFPVELAYV
ncbi:MAG TPA: hypothetical protein VGX94_08025 [Terriglobia bacterium]|nr:hypothetical protein [Terriglobia bacterium]